MIRAGRSFSGRERHCFFLNTGAAPDAEGRFANISAVSGLDYPDDGRAVALTDWDNDGDVDMWISNRNAPRLRLMRNNTPAGNHFLALRLEGNGKTTNRDAIGARVEILFFNPQSGNSLPKSIKTLRAGEGYLAQSSKWLHFGLGNTEAIEKVVVRWPGGETEQFTGIDVDRPYRLIQGSGNALEIGLPKRDTKIVHSVQKPLPVSETARIPLVELLPMPKSNYLGFDGRLRELPIKPGRLLLVNLWASWCPLCQTEMKEFTDSHEKLKAAGIDILALSIEGLGPDAAAGARADAISAVSKVKFPYATGFATPQVVSTLRELHKQHIALDTQLPLPSSFLIDRQGCVSVIYKGAVTVDQLLKDVHHSEGRRPERFTGSAPLGGQPIRHSRVEQAAVNNSEFVRFHFALYLEQSGRYEQAIKEYTKVIKTDPDSFLVYNNLGKLMRQLYRYDQAREHFKEALRIKPDYTIAHNNLGNLLQKLGEITEAISHHQEAIRIDPNYANAHNSLGNALLKHRKTAEAIEHYQHALRINPDFAAAHMNLADVLQGQGKTEKAIEHLRRAAQITAHDPVAHTRLALAVAHQGKTVEAIKHYLRALEVNPNHQPALNNMARIRATHPDAKLRDGKQAVAMAKRCCELDQYRVAIALDTLAAAYAEVGRFEDAVNMQIRAIELTPKANSTKQKARLQLYMAGKPFREKL